MKFNIYHQLGWQFRWNLDSITNENTGDGAIIAPRSMKKSDVEGLESSIKEKAIFDPEFFVPSDAAKQISTYNFHPSQMPGGFETGKYTAGHCETSTSGCIDFQIKNNFKFITIPTRYYDKIPVDQWIEFQKTQFVDPFLKEIKKRQVRKEILLQIILDEQMIKDQEYSHEILNWITSINEIHGVYLITRSSDRNQNKQIRDVNFLYSQLVFIDALQENDLKMVLGYLNNEAIILSLANPSILTIGSFEKTRIFNPKNYEVDDGHGGGRGPTARLFSPKLIDWIEYPYVEQLNENYPEFMAKFGNNTYKDTMLSKNPIYSWNPNKSHPYRHFFIEGSKQLEEVSLTDGEDRYSFVRNIIDSAINEYSKLHKLDFKFVEAERYGSHLPLWLNAVDKFAKKQGWGK